ncbi:AMP-binding protein [Streptomonospora litoralis]|uniref:Acetyl-coenzyme A synthetase n=1 Tax=Streptomonospora litoralis TaxID=2498135 RepID=A0A4P6Q648_9ACTN|nr:AMP-binding protein [Streptomonospora litoralis]QBI54257.1 Acetyl-coenzyme A synthetase [Streptomonospora litoralis]
MPDPAQQVRDWLATYDAPSASVADLLCDRHPRDHVALTEIGTDLAARDTTFGELADRSAALAAGMAELGVGRGDHVATMVGRGTDAAVCALAVWRLGAVLVPLLTAFAPSAIAHRLTSPATKLFICDDDQRAKLDAGPDLPAEAGWPVATTGTAPLRDGDHTLAGLMEAGAVAPAAAVAVGGDSPFVLMHTAGSAGPAKGIPIPVRALAAFHAYHHYGLDVADDDVYWNTADRSGAYGLYHGLISPLLAGQRTLHLNAGFDPELLLDVLAIHEVTNLAASPTVYRSLRATLKTLPPEIAVRNLSSAGEPLGTDMLEWARDVFGVPVRDHYGQPELGMCAGHPGHPDLAAEPRTDSLGTALPGWRATVLEPVADEEAPPGAFGRIAVDAKASPLMWFTGYDNAPTSTAARFTPDGRWYLTGDTGTRDREGSLYFSSRDDDAILTSGYRIGPFDVESALLEHPEVEEAAVYGVPDDLHGQLVAATVVLREGTVGDDELAESLREIVRNRFATHAYPRRISFADQLPRSPSGKIRRSRLGPPRA